MCCDSHRTLLTAVSTVVRPFKKIAIFTHHIDRIDRDSIFQLKRNSPYPLMFNLRSILDKFYFLIFALNFGRNGHSCTTLRKEKWKPAIALAKVVRIFIRTARCFVPLDMIPNVVALARVFEYAKGHLITYVICPALILTVFRFGIGAIGRIVRPCAIFLTHSDKHMRSLSI